MNSQQIFEGKQVLFLHTNYPAQFRFLVKDFALMGWKIYFASNTCKNRPLPQVNHIQLPQNIDETKSKTVQIEERSLSTFFCLLREKRNGLNPSLIYVHSGWALGYFLKDLFPKAKVIAYSEWWFDLNSEDFRFDLSNKDVVHSGESKLRMVLRNQGFALEMSRADAVIAPTEWQREQLPWSLRQRCEVIFDGIDGEMFCPILDNAKEVREEFSLSREQFLITYATRGLEPYRGFPEFSRAMINVLKRHPNWRLAIAGKDQPSYYTNSRVKYGQQAMDRFKEAGVDHQVMMLGRLSLNRYRDLLRRSDLHCYFTRPYVLSWSCLEAAMVGCKIIASDIKAVREFLRNDQNVSLVDHTQSDLSQKIEKEAVLAEAQLRIKGRIQLKKVIWGQRNILRDKIERKTCIQQHRNLVERLLL